MAREVMWRPWTGPGLEHLRLSMEQSGTVADGLIVAVEDNRPFRLHYRVVCDTEWRAHEVQLSPLNAGEFYLHLFSDGRGRWSDDRHGTIPRLDGCIDVDISATPFTNSLPVQRLQLEVGESADILVAYIAVPDLSVEPVLQRYTRIPSSEGDLYRYEQPAIGFRADLYVDADGLVVDYPQLFRRAWPGESNGSVRA